MKFNLLWDAHPMTHDQVSPCRDMSSGKPRFDNQCAIRMGVAFSICNFLVKNGISLYDYPGDRCWYHPQSDNHTLRVEELTNYLKKKLPKRSMTYKRASVDDPISFDDFGASGIIAILNFWGEGDYPQGDHIDLVNWDGYMTDGTHVDDYLSRAEKAYHWEII